MPLVITPRLAGPLAVAVADFRKHFGMLDRALLADLAVLQEELRLLAVGGRSGSSFDPEEFAAQAGVMNPLAVTYEDAGQALACSSSKVKRLVAAGELQTIGEGRGSRIVTASLNAYVARTASPLGVVS